MLAYVQASRAQYRGHNPTITPGTGREEGEAIIFSSFSSTSLELLKSFQ